MSEDLEDLSHLTPKEIEERKRELLGLDELFTTGLTQALQDKGINPHTPVPIVSESSSTHKSQRIITGINQAESPSSYEEAILILSTVRDNLIRVFSHVNKDRETGGIVVESIRSAEDGISKLGGTIESFNPLTELSGLSTPAQEEESEQVQLGNALKVAENTKESYSLFEISNMMIKMLKGRPTILLQFKGSDDNKDFIVNGQVMAKTDFSGNEAIDYVRGADQHALTVKAQRLGRWTDVSSEFDIRLVDVTNRQVVDG